MQDTILEPLGLANDTEQDYPFLETDNVWRHDKDMTETFSDDWFGEAIARPDTVLLDIKKVVKPESAPQHTTVFFRKAAHWNAAHGKSRSRS
jgi:hypothetical protein